MLLGGEVLFENILKKISLTKKIAIFYAVIFSVSLFILSACTLYSVQFYQFLEVRSDIDVTIQSILKESIGSREFIEKAELAEQKNIFLDITQNGHQVFRSNKISVKTEKILSNFILEDDDDFFIKEVTQNVAGVSYEIKIVKDLYYEKKFLKILFGVIAFIDFAGMFISIILGYGFGKNILKPIGEVTSAAQKISGHNLKEKIPLPTAKDELYTLTVTINEMIERLNNVFERQQQFLTNASHELRTPLSIIKGYSDLIDRWGKDDREVLDTSILAIKDEVENMSQLISKLLILAKTNETCFVNNEAVELSKMLSDLVEDTKMIGTGQKIVFSGLDGITINTDEVLLRQLIRIVLDNAVKFTEPSGIITVCCEVNSTDVCIKITDTGCGIPADQLEWIFERFYTTDRARCKEQSGSGLGLSIAKQIAELLHINLVVYSTVGKGTEVQVIIS